MGAVGQAACGLWPPGQNESALSSSDKEEDPTLRVIMTWLEALEWGGGSTRGYSNAECPGDQQPQKEVPASEGLEEKGTLEFPTFQCQVHEANI
ncbi:UNVERIFIED_CONTAM: hypothetical protein K2H54_054651 [Gekko kuhli]